MNKPDQPIVKPRISVVICFRDWGGDRLGVAVERLVKSTLGAELEVVVSDFGSDNEAEVREAVEAAGGRIVRSPRVGPWSRSRALNAGVRGTETEYLITTDADMIFTEDAVRRLLAMLEQDASVVHLVQCRDLSPAYGAETAGDASDSVLEKHSAFRPRWGMGGLIAFRRTDFDLLGGYDERMEIYGGEDIDFAQRIARSGRRLNWVDDPAVRIYHIWHPSSRAAAQKSPEATRAIEVNRDIMLNDKSWMRNFNIGKRAAPAVSVLIASYNRADYLADSINSVLAQSLEDIEVIVLDDGSDDHTNDVLASIGDPRLRYGRHENRGVAYTRNRLTEMARSPLVAIHDDDDIMLPWRLERQLAVSRPDLAGTYGGWVDFDNETGETGLFPGKAFPGRAFIYSGQVMLHGTIMIHTELLRRFPYREHLRAGVDYNLFSRLANAGITMEHTGQIHMLRRMHGMNLTHTIGAEQRAAATRTNIFLRRRNSPEQERNLRNEARNLAIAEVAHSEDLDASVLVYLPGHLTRRQAVIRADHEAGAQLRALIGADRLIRRAGWAEDNDLLLSDPTYAELAALRGIRGLEVNVTPPAEDASGTGTDDEDLSMVIAAAVDSGMVEKGVPCILSITTADLPGEALDQDGLRRRYWLGEGRCLQVDVRRFADNAAAVAAEIAGPTLTTLRFLPAMIA